MKRIQDDLYCVKNLVGFAECGESKISDKKLIAAEIH